MSIRTAILEEMQATAQQGGKNLVQKIEDSTLLLESGLDSLGFAILVTRLEGRLGYDPFTLMDEPVYPRTFGEFVKVYEVHQPTGAEPAS